tara:strand:+ start:1461 stop:2240 length:780 start_codon:yes stop_codon:yes gene_type:complete
MGAKMIFYSEHYEKCKNGNASLYDHVFEMNPFALNSLDVKTLAKTVDGMISYNNGCVEDQWSIKLENISYIPQLESICKDLATQIEEKYFGSPCKFEFIHCYRNKTTATKESSWKWHYDDCPREFMKVGLYLNDVNTDNGCMQILNSKSGPKEVESYRTHPNAIKGDPPPVYPKSRIPDTEVDRLLSDGYEKHNVVGPSGTNFLFTPNIIHRATVPKVGVTPRDVIIFFVRPSLTKITNYTRAANYFKSGKNVKRYELD